MARAEGITGSLILPPALEKYDRQNENETRRLIALAASRLTRWESVADIPAPITAFGALTGVADSFAYFTSVTAMALASLTPYARTILAAASAAAARTVLDVYSKSETDALSPARAVTTITTASLANNVFENSSKAVPFYSGTLITITADRACWVRFYGNATDRIADATRTLGVTAAAGIGLLAEFVFTGAATVQVSPIADIANNDTVKAKTLYYAIENTSGSTSTVTVTITAVPLEK